jgi:hypothetical protein
MLLLLLLLLLISPKVDFILSRKSWAAPRCLYLKAACQCVNGGGAGAGAGGGGGGGSDAYAVMFFSMTQHPAGNPHPADLILATIRLVAAATGMEDDW